jgi:hypothetical protein
MAARTESHWYGDVCTRHVFVEGQPKRRQCR